MSRSNTVAVNRCPTTAHSTSSTSVGRYITRFKIEPAHRAVAALYPCSQYAKEQVLKNIVISDQYGVKPSFMHDCFKKNSYSVGMIKHHVDCLTNVRIYLNVQYVVPPNKICYHYNTTIEDNWLNILTVSFISGQSTFDRNFETRTELPKIKKGTYSIVERYQEFLKVVNERRNSYQH